MSEARDADQEFDDGQENEDAESVSEEREDGDDGDDEGESARPAAKPVDWENKSHSYAGQAAAERSRRHAAEKRANELETRLEALESRTGGDPDELLALIGHLRDDEDDPVGDIAAVKRALKLFRQREMGSVEETRAQVKANREVEAVKSSMADAEQDFALEHPDYHEAAQFYRKDRTEELQELGYRGDALMAKLSQDLFGLVRTAFASGMDPAERVYKLAAKRGFKPGGRAADKKLDALDRAGQTGIRPQARSVAGVLTWADVAKLDGAARDKAWAKLRDRERARK
jgi:hypothetical protein